MNWIEFAEKIGGKFEESSTGFVGGDTIVKAIIKEYEEEKISIQKTIRRSYGSSSHSNVEKLAVEYFSDNSDFGNNRITRKNFIRRISKKNVKQYDIEGGDSVVLQKILSLTELKYLLQHPKSELILQQNSITFRSQSLGELNENLEQVFHAIEILKGKLKML